MKHPDRRRAAAGPALAPLLLVAAATRAAGECPDHLFVVARSKNANIVAYDAKTEPSGELASKAVVAYWLLDGDATRREELNAIEWKRAYGFSLKKGDARTYILYFNAGKKRPVTIRMRDGCPVAIGKIQGQTAILRKLFVQSKEGGLRPTVEYVEFFGEDPESGHALYEKLIPK
jgi:hypothetical protein